MEINAIFIDAINREITKVRLDGTLENLYKLLDCRTVAGAYPDHIGNNSLMVDDEALMQNSDTIQGFYIGNYPIYSSALVYSSSDTGKPADVTLTLRPIKQLVTWETFHAS